MKNRSKLIPTYKVYTDGACSGNPGPGGYAFIYIKQNGEYLRVNGGSKETTNNRMELTAIIRALKHIHKEMEQSVLKKCKVDVYSDSAYCINPINEGWIYSWEKNLWKTKSGEPVKNVELWQHLLGFINIENFDITFHKVKGHSGNKYNEEVDRLAKEGIARICEMK